MRISAQKVLSFLGFLSMVGATVLIAGMIEGAAMHSADLAGQAPAESCIKSGCHDAYALRKTQHQPIPDETCDACHELTDEEKHKWKLTESEPELCVQCHDETLKGQKFLHGPVAAGTCTACHDPHGSKHEMILLAEPNAMCARCHTDVGERAAKVEYKHKPVQEGCTSCHLAHGGDNKTFTKSAVPKLCLDCHGPIAETLGKATVMHDAVTGGSSCSGCHDPHGSTHEGMLIKESMDLCLTCHDKELVSGADKLLNLKALLQAKPHHHGPIRDRDCVSCHAQIHGGSEFRLLMSSYPAGFYAPFDEKTYALCFECHEADLVNKERTATHTGFRNGNRNLHFLHVNRAKGRSCRACHNTHASDNPFHVTQSVPFGRSSWMLPVGFKKTDAGGSCQPGCHKRYVYDRDKPVDNLRRGPVKKKADAVEVPAKPATDLPLPPIERPPSKPARKEGGR